ncbi:hypothetical protein [Pleionea mediterranea]|uniref:Uncharacterized protein n=1 Tax=Pleionea mediterranea TaxID=523701 RepID=A0A316FKI0_9GAMM|nr:hypothetical protein [Pleionea mediterranea]PWK48622.1 hypothetical protein C8D97_109173 [Pleionea mediterranea]
MDEQNLPLLLGLELSILLCLVLAGGLWFTFRELRRARKHNMKVRREHTRLKRKLASAKPADENDDPSKAIPPLQFLQQSIDENKAFYEEEFPEQPIDKLDEQVGSEQLSLAIRHLIFSKERDLRADGDKEFSIPLFVKNTKEVIAKLSSSPSTATQPTNEDEPTEGSSEGSESDHYKNLYDELLVTLQRSKETIKSLALRLSDIIDEGMDEDQLNSLLEELNNSMDAFGELSGISSTAGGEQLEDEVKEIRRAYEMGMNLMEHFENAIKQTSEIDDAVDEHSEVVSTNRNNYEDNETIDRDAILTNNKRYTRMLDDAKKICSLLSKELDSGKDIIGNFLAMTRKFQDQSTRIVILQSREKQLNSDLKQMKQAQQDSIEHLKARDRQLQALHAKFVEESNDEQVEKICTYANEINRIENEIKALDPADTTSATKKKRTELIQQRLAIESQINELVGE